MPDHVHLLIRKHKDQAEEMIKHFVPFSFAAFFMLRMIFQGFDFNLKSYSDVP